MMFRFSFLSSVFSLFPLWLFAQFISHGPVFGGLTHQSARVYLRTQTPQNFTLEISESPNFTNVQSLPVQTTALDDQSVIVNLSGLNAYQMYYVRFRFGATLDSRSGKFRSFPTPGSPGNYVFTTGSCQETVNMKVFEVMPLHQPNLFIHTGDYTYPSYQLPNTYPGDFSMVQEAWRRRYQEVNMTEMLFEVPMDYMPDDDDAAGPNRELWYSVDFNISNNHVYNFFNIDSIPAAHWQNAIKGYVDYFPGYPCPDTSIGVYHKFTMGNCEFFVTDARSFADSPTRAFVYDSLNNHWTYSPPPGHSILGTQQLQWLLDGLQNSTAQWKFVVCGVPFNRGIRRLIDVGMGLQGLPFEIAGQYGTGFRIAGSFAGYWAGYPEDQDAVLNFVSQNQIKNVIWVTGDTHHNVMDNGVNAGFPELNASGMSVTTTELAYQINATSLLLGYPSVKDSLWNRGGNGIDNLNFKNGFGKIEVFGNDSVRLCVIDEDNITLSCFTVPDNSYVGIQEMPATESVIGVVYPNPTGDRVFVGLIDQVGTLGIQKLWIADLSGKALFSVDVSALGNETLLEVDISHLPAGVYVLSVALENRVLSTRVIKR